MATTNREIGKSEKKTMEEMKKNRENQEIVPKNLNKKFIVNNRGEHEVFRGVLKEILLFVRINTFF